MRAQGPCLLWGPQAWDRVGRDILFLRFRRVGIGGFWQGMQYGGGLESSGNVVGGTGCPQATPSLPPREGTGPTVMPFVLALGLGVAVLSEEQGAITRTRRHGAERS